MFCIARPTSSEYFPLPVAIATAKAEVAMLSCA